MFQISEVQESPAFNGRRSFLTPANPRLQITATARHVDQDADGPWRDFGHDSRLSAAGNLSVNSSVSATPRLVAT